MSFIQYDLPSVCVWFHTIYACIFCMIFAVCLGWNIFSASVTNLSSSLQSPVFHLYWVPSCLLLVTRLEMNQNRELASSLFGWPVRVVHHQKEESVVPRHKKETLTDLFQANCANESVRLKKWDREVLNESLFHCLLSTIMRLAQVWNTDSERYLPIYDGQTFETVPTMGRGEVEH